MRKFHPPIGRGPRLGTTKKREIKSLATMSCIELAQTRIRPRDKNKVYKELDKRGLPHDHVEVM